MLSQVRGKDAESVLGESGLVGQLKKQLAERMLSAELTHHLKTEAAQATGEPTTATARAPRPCSRPAGIVTDRDIVVAVLALGLNADAIQMGDVMTREPRPWILMAGPVVAVVAGFITLYLAIRNADPLVVDQNYMEGLAINRVLERDRSALLRGYRARVVAPALALLSLQAAAAEPIATATVQHRDVDRTYAAEAVVEAVKQSTVSTQVTGRIVEINYDVGDYVKKGQVIVRIDQAEARQLVAGGEAQVAVEGQ